MNTTVDKGDMVLLDCLVSGNPSPNVVWLKDNFALPLQAGIAVLSNNSLLIVSARRQDSGVYTCEAFNGKGRARAWAFLLVRGNLQE